MKEESGQAIVEFALVISIFLMLLFGVIDFGRMLNDYLTVNQVSKNAARTISVGQSPTVVPNITVTSNPTNVSTLTRGSNVIVTATKNFTFITPFLKFIGSNGSNSITIKVSTEMRME